MCAYDEKYCERCGISFECKSGNITQCQCYDVKLTHEERSYISLLYNDCLCKNCMGALQLQYRQEKHNITQMQHQIRSLKNHR